MRLINVNTYEVVKHTDDDAVKYAILSHTWGAEEVTLQEMNLLDESIKAKKGFKKIEYTCQQARRERLDWAWVDTCCIDVTSSAEHSEAINSMFRYYRQSQVCYVYLADLPDHRDGALPNIFTLRKCRWFTRGWCLQELLAPTILDFYSRGWEMAGSLSDLVKSVSEITRIDADYLTKVSALDDASIAARMSWAAGRQCTRLEDTAYSLLGIFDVHMPLLYGEGSKAFVRLQEEIWKETDDHTLLAWHVPDEDHRAWEATGVFAESPEDFRFSSQVVSTGPEHGVPSGMTKRGLSLFASTHELVYPFLSNRAVYEIPLNCADMAHDVEDGGRQIMLLASGVSTSEETFARVATPAHFYQDGFHNFASRKAGIFGEEHDEKTIYIQKKLSMHGRSPVEMHIAMPDCNVLFLLEGPMQPTWYENEWSIDRRRHGAHGSTFPSVPWCPMGDFRWFQASNIEYNKIPESSFFILQMGGSASPYTDVTAAVIEMTALRRRQSLIRYAHFLLVQREKMEGGFRVGMKMPVEIHCAISMPYSNGASIALLPWDEDERAKHAGAMWDGALRSKRNCEYRKKMEQWTEDNLNQSNTHVNGESRLLLAQASLDLKEGRNKGRRLHVEMQMKRIGWWNRHAEESVTPHIYLRFTMVDL